MYAQPAVMENVSCAWDKTSLKRAETCHRTPLTGECSARRNSGVQVVIEGGDRREARSSEPRLRHCKPAPR